MEKSKKRVVIIGAGPAGLTAAWELCRRSDTEVIVIEQDNTVGGISRTVRYKGNCLWQTKQHKMPSTTTT